MVIINVGDVACETRIVLSRFVQLPTSMFGTFYLGVRFLHFYGLLLFQIYNYLICYIYVESVCVCCICTLFDIKKQELETECYCTVVFIHEVQLLNYYYYFFHVLFF